MANGRYAIVVFVAVFQAATAAALEQPNGVTIPTPPGCLAGRPTGLAAAFACECDMPGVCNIGDPCPSETTCDDGMHAVCESTLYHSFNDNMCIPSNLAGLDPVAEASTLPETFSPTCPLTFTVVTRGTAIFQDAFGWYNVTGERPDPSDLHVMLDCEDGPGATAVLDIRSHPDYRGGEIGFFLVTPESLSARGACASADCCSTVSRAMAGEGQIFYSQAAFNPDFIGDESFIHLLVYDSHLTDRKFYFAWEDIYGGSNNDFTDLVTSVEGVECAGGGTPCETGMMGVCSFGVNECRDGTLQCIGLFAPAPLDTCNGADDDCDGEIDDGAICERPDEVCQDGRCVPNCDLSDEFVCAAGFECDAASGFCVETACAAVDCMEGTVCRGGICVGGCEDVICPHGQTCRLGSCLDPCEGVICPEAELCSEGACVPGCGRCGGLVCTEPLSCDMPSGRCVDPSCPTECAAGTFCREGTCVDDCDGAVCPSGQHCEAGECLLPRREPAPDAGTDAGRDAGPVTPDIDAGMDAGRDAGPFTTTPRTGKNDCTCRAGRAPDAHPLALLAALSLFAVIRLRRRKRPPSPPTAPRSR